MENYNPSAFPQSDFSNIQDAEFKGMTLRDYFAAKAMQSLITRFDEKFVRDVNYPEHFGIGELSYNIADQMLKERFTTSNK